MQITNDGSVVTIPHPYDEDASVSSDSLHDLDSDASASYHYGDDENSTVLSCTSSQSTPVTTQYYKYERRESISSNEEDDSFILHPLPDFGEYESVDDGSDIIHPRTPESKGKRGLELSTTDSVSTAMSTPASQSHGFFPEYTLRSDNEGPNDVPWMPPKKTPPSGCVPAWITDASPGIKFIIVASTALLVGSIVLVTFATYGVKDASSANIRGSSIGISPTAMPSSVPTAVSDISDLAKNSAGFRVPTSLPSVDLSDLPSYTPISPSESPPHAPSIDPAVSPGDFPLVEPTGLSNHIPTNIPSVDPSSLSNRVPTNLPSLDAIKFPPTQLPSYPKTYSPTTTSSSHSPSVYLTDPLKNSPTNSPTSSPTISTTTSTTTSLTNSLSNSPTISLTASPTISLPTISPTNLPTNSPTNSPINSPTNSPTNSPANSPTSSLTISPTNSPTNSPTMPLTSNQPSITSPKQVFYVASKIGAWRKNSIAAPEYLTSNGGRWMIHLGDWQDSNGGCDETDYTLISDKLKNSSIPVFVLPGNNEWENCIDNNASRAMWRDHFVGFENNWALNFEVKRQINRPENFSFIQKRMMVIGLNMVYGVTTDDSGRIEDNLEWVTQNIKSNRTDMDIVTIYGHSGTSILSENNLFFDNLSGLVNIWNSNGPKLTVIYVKQSKYGLSQYKINNIDTLRMLNIEANQWPPVEVQYDKEQKDITFDDTIGNTLSYTY